MFGSREERQWIRDWRRLNSVADKLGLTEEWVVCPVCGQQTWRFAPHGGDPCPLAVSIAEAQGLKFDAERMMALRTGLHLDRMGESMRGFMEEHGMLEPEPDEEDME